MNDQSARLSVRNRSPKFREFLRIAVDLGGIFLFALFLGCEKPSRSIALLPMTTGVPLWDVAHAGSVRGAKGCGLSIHYDAPSREDDLQGQLSLFEKFRREGYAGIIVAPVQIQALRNPIQRAISSGLPVVVIGSEDLEIRSPNLTHVLSDNRAGGRMAADKIAALLRGKGTVGIMGLDQRRPSSLEREAAFERELSSSQDVRIMERRNGSANLAEEEQTAQQLFTGKDRVDAIVALSATSTRGAYYAMMGHVPAKRVFIIGFDQDLLPPVRMGEIQGVIAERAGDMGQLAAEAICDRVQGKQMPSTTSLSPLLVTPWNINSPAVAKQFDRQWWDPHQE